MPSNQKTKKKVNSSKKRVNSSTKKENNTLKPNRNSFDFALITVIIVLLLFGLIIVLSASAPASYLESKDSYAYFRKQFIFAGGGFFVMLFVSKIDYRIYKKFYWLAYVVAILAIFIVYIPGVGRTINGARRWAVIGGISFQPSEITKILLIFFFAGYLTDHKSDLKSFTKGFMVPIFLLALPVGLLFGFQNHLSVGIIITLVSILMFCIAGIRMTYILAAGGTGIIAGTIYIMNSIANNSTSFRFRRYLTFLNPWADPTGDGYQIIHSLYAIGSGGFLGAGLGKSTQKYAYIPEPENDFIFAVLAEELGFVGCVALIALFGFFIWRGIKISRNCEDMFGSLLAIGITSFVGIQVILNIAVVTSIMPTTGISLPFFSYGGTALLILLFSMGVLLNISRHKKVEEEKED